MKFMASRTTIVLNIAITSLCTLEYLRLLLLDVQRLIRVRLLKDHSTLKIQTFLGKLHLKHSKRMRIAVNTRFLIKGKFEGVGWYTYEILKRMVLSHPEDEFIFIHDRPLAPEYIFAKNVKSIKTIIPSRHPTLWVLWFEYAIPRILRKLNADVFLSFDGHCSVKTDTPTVLVLHDLAYLHYPEEIKDNVLRFYRKYIPQYIHKAKHIVSVSQHGKQDLLQQFPNVSPRKISVVGNGCREIFKPLAASEQQVIRNQNTDGNPYFFFVGAVQPRKNISRLIQAFDIFAEKHAGVQLLIAGKSAGKSAGIKEAYEQSKHQNRIKFLGFVEDSIMSRLMAASAAVVYPSLFEGFGVPVLEAMHCEVPVITTQKSSMSEVAGETALLVDPKDPKDISQAMSKIIGEPALAKKLIEAAKLQRNKYDWDLAAEKMYSVLNDNFRRDG